MHYTLPAKAATNLYYPLNYLLSEDCNMLSVIRISHPLLGWIGCCLPYQAQLQSFEHFCNPMSRSYIFLKIGKMKNVGPNKQSEMLFHVYIKFCC